MIIVAAIVAIAAALFTVGRPRRLVDAAPSEAVTPVHEMPGHEIAVQPLAISVIVPARDEANSLPTLLGALAASSRRPAEIIVVDDHSTDGTSVVARASGVVGLRVVEAPTLPEGWTGKNWACHVGATQAGQPTLLFLDADTCPAPDALTSLERAYVTNRGLVSVQPFHRTTLPYEELSAVFNVVSLMGSGAFSPLAAKAVRVAFGPCLMMSAADYRRVGGHLAVRNEVVEDIALAANFASAGLPVSCWLGGDRMSFRMYPDGVRSLAQGWTKNIAAGAGRAPLSRVLPSVVWVALLATVAAASIVGVVKWIAGAGAPVAALVAYAIVVVHVAYLLRRIGSFRVWTAVLFPVPLSFFVAIFCRSLVAVASGSSVTWRGRAVPSRTSGRVRDQTHDRRSNPGRTRTGKRA